jgi:hypothetical protein
MTWTEACQALLDEFPFPFVAERMRREKWQWRNGVPYYPDAGELRKRAASLLEDLGRSKGPVCTGGLEVHKRDGAVTLSFGRGQRVKPRWASLTKFYSELSAGNDVIDRPEEPYLTICGAENMDLRTLELLAKMFQAAYERVKAKQESSQPSQRLQPTQSVQLVGGGLWIDKRKEVW